MQTAKNAAVYGSQAALVIQGGRKYPTLPAVTDERGILTYRQVDEMSSALAHGLIRLGVSEGSVVGLVCRDHRGLVLAMAACGKTGARLVLMNTGFALRSSRKCAHARASRRFSMTVSSRRCSRPSPPTCPECSPGSTSDADLPTGIQTIDDVIAANSS